MATRRVRAIDRLASARPGTPREQLLSLILCGDARFDGQLVRDPAELVARDAAVTLEPRGFVGRGATKLDHALLLWNLPVAGKVFLDAGASTGGFTQALLLRGAEAVHAVDVGYNQLDYALRTDPRVIVHERTNIMDIHALDPPAAAAVADLSFRSLVVAARRLLDLAAERWAVLLMKPQFEWRDPPPGFDGTVPDDAVQGIVMETVARLAEEGVHAHACAESPIRGRAGNREYLVLVRHVPAADGGAAVRNAVGGDDRHGPV